MASKSVGRMCVVAGCSKRQSDGVSVHVFPKDERLRAAWCRFVKLTRADWSGPSKYTVICSDHFNEDCYEVHFSLMKDFGIPAKKRLRQGSIPSIYPKRKRDQLNDAFLESPHVNTPTPVRGAHAKRERNRVLAELLHDNTEVEEIQEESQDQDECVGIQTTPVPFPTPVSEEKSVSMACQTESTRKRSVKIQVAARNKEKGLQVDLQPRVRSIGIQVDVRDDLPAPRPPPAPVPVPDSSSGEESIQTENETASLYEPSGTSSDDSHVQDINTEAPCNPLEDRKFIISETKLLELFSNCRRCHKYTAASVQQVLGTMVKIAVECEFCGFTWQWSSQPFIGNIPVGNIGLSAAILFSGALVSKVLRVLNCMGVATITRRTFNSLQSAILFPVIARVWDKHQQEYASRALERGDPLVIGGDGRADSPGHCAKFGSYSTIDLEEGIVIDIQLVQSNEVKNSLGMEKKGLERTIAWMKDQDLEIGTIVTDRHVQIQKWIRENLTETTHYYDVWHVAKGLKKKILAASKQKECENLAKWIKSLTNHLYWVAASTPDGNGDFMWAKWESVENHIHNIHEGHNDLFPSCAHDTLEGDEQKKKWIKPGKTLF
ncbi:uncharacterized protein LOC133198949 [Saccostrea echinata]|uniref:uncharacterized protein LOC133198949 n=1 Tax=Saccostrea echinata TaxID=191078 RepID=UPI002A800ACF|nr:uncharacterized protein LOC133198949 [Saccostrea echinata]